MRQHGGLSPVAEAAGPRQAATNMRQEGPQCQEGVQHPLADRPDRLVEGRCHRPAVGRVPAADTPCLSSHVRPERTVPRGADGDTGHEALPLPRQERPVQDHPDRAGVLPDTHRSA